MVTSPRDVIAEFIDYSDPFRPCIKTNALIGIINERDSLREMIRTNELSLELQILEHGIEKKAREKAEKELATWEELLKI
ncbi:hypothetical protein DID88_007698 [Monilinia fructigena]|uniref:Uncharacterized protein n=1 Tax=Monilinia fructigena TaxID=38457 RepID=A0A395J3S0_9HELO|nr:hypothetical protein DID88_007698 [Monilinia fructigena]